MSAAMIAMWWMPLGCCCVAVIEVFRILLWSVTGVRSLDVLVAWSR